MGGNSKAKKASSGGSFSVMSFFKGGSGSGSGSGGNMNVVSRMMRGRRWEADGPVDYMNARKVWPSQEDNTNKGKWVADPRIDTKASAFIAHFHATRVTESELQVFQRPPPAAA